MNESILKALMNLFAIITDYANAESTQLAREQVRKYLRTKFSKELVDKYLQLFDQFLENYHKFDKRTEVNVIILRKRQASNQMKALKICEQINSELEQEPKVLILLELMEFVRYDLQVTKEEQNYISLIAQNLNISQEEFSNLRSFVYGNYIDVNDKENLIVVNGQENFDDEAIKHIYLKRLNGSLEFLHLPSTNTIIFHYLGKENLYLNGHAMDPLRAYLLPVGSMIKSTRTAPVYYSVIAGLFHQSLTKERIIFEAPGIAFRFPGSNDGIHQFDFKAESGEFIGIMGGSGVGKSTLLNVLNGNLKLTEGRITINGLDIHKDAKQLNGVIGFVPQDDLLIEEITVFQNLYYNAKLCFSDFTEEQILKSVKQALIDFDLVEARDLVVGDPLRKILSGGQRKRLNIAMEMMRQPSVLFVDEPTSGLSSMDSEKVMILLKRQTLRGRLVIVNIHQPSSDLYKMFDRLMIMDKGGWMVYNGNPMDAITYFQHKANFVNPDESECLTCGNVKTDQTLRIIEARMVDTYGRQIRKRKVSPEEWNQMHKEASVASSKEEPITEYPELPPNSFSIPNRIQQFQLFSSRSLLAKVTNRQYLLISLLEAPVLALILGFFTKYIAGTPADPNAYVFSENKNIPAFLFMSVIVSLFIGLVISAEEIFKDKRILKRERFLNLSYSSYIHAKIVNLFVISAIQSLSYVLISNYILEIKGLTIEFWALLFSTSCVANLIGLNISASFNSVINIYILIPFILVPQLLLSGVVVNFNDLHKRLTSDSYTPFVGDVMISRWAYEAMTVTMYKRNKFEKTFYDVEQRISESNFNSTFIIPNLQSKLAVCEDRMRRRLDMRVLEHDFKILRTEITKFTEEKEIPVRPFELSEMLRPSLFTSDIAHRANDFLEKVRNYYSAVERRSVQERDDIYEKMAKKLGKDKILQMKDRYHNKYLANYVLDTYNLQKLCEGENYLIQRKDPIYQIPESKLGRAHFYAPVKKIFNKKIDTFWFNIFIIWFFGLILYFTLRINLLRKAIHWVEKLRFSNPENATYKRQ